MERVTFFTEKEKKELFILYRKLIRTAGDSISKKEIGKLKEYLAQTVNSDHPGRNSFGMNPVIRGMGTAVVVCDEMGVKGACLTGVMLHEAVKNEIISMETVKAEFGEDVANIIRGLVKPASFTQKARP